MVDQGDFGIVLGVVGIVITVALGVPALRRRRVAPHWTEPHWTVGTMKVRTQRLPVLTARWGVRGSLPIQAVECAVQSPAGKWHVCAWPKGTVQPPQERLYTYVNLLDGKPFNSTIASPADIGKPVQDLTQRAIKGEYQLRITWHEPEKPTRKRQKTFTYLVT